jgi:hypothetical protein
MKGENMTTTNDKARLHTHFGRIAITLGDNPCVYVSPQQARALARDMRMMARLIESGQHPATRVVIDGVGRNEADGARKIICV